MRKLLLFVAAVVLLNVVSFAQLTFGPKIGLNMSGTRFKDETNSVIYQNYDPKLKAGLQLGFLVDYEILYNFSVRGELQYNQAGYKYVQNGVFGNIEGKKIYNYLTIPINAVYKVKLGPGRFQASVGPYAGVALIGKFKEENKTSGVTEEGDLNFDPVSADSTFGSSQVALIFSRRSGKALDAGLNFGVGYQYRRFLVNVNYSLGFVNRVGKFDDPSPTVQDVQDQLKLQNRMLAFSFTYLLGKIE